MDLGVLFTIALVVLPLALVGPLLYLALPRKRPAGFVIAAVIIFVNAAAIIVLLCEGIFTATTSLLFDCIVVFVLGCIFVAVFRQHRTRTALWIGGLFIAAFLIVALIDFTPVKPYRRFYNSIHNGMTRAEVIAELHRQFPARGRHPVPALRNESDSQMMFFLDPKQSAYNAEGVFLTLTNDRVAAKVYSPD